MVDELKFETLINILGSVFEEAQDTRASNKQYSLSELGLAAFSVFYMQSPSFLAWQREMENRKGKSNVQNLLGTEQIPSDEQIKNVLDAYHPDSLAVVYRYAMNTLAATGKLKQYACQGRMLVALDGTQYHHSKKINCSQCTQIEREDKVHYQHSVVLPVLVSSQRSEVLCLEPEFVLPQDGHEKQDCEIAAAKRWLSTKLANYDLGKVVILGDDLYCRQPMCEQVQAAKANFVFICKPKSHAHLYEYLALTPLEHNEIFLEDQVKMSYRFANGLPLRDSPDALMLNWCDISITDKHDKQIYYNSFATDILLNSETVMDICSYGRARWKIENEGNNTLKTKGYHFEHNFGHGQHYLAALLLSLMLLAFLFHTLFDLLDRLYQAIRQRLATRKTFFDDLRALTRYHCFDSWYHLLNFMAHGLELDFDSS